MTTKTDHAKEQARAQLDSIVEMVTALENDTQIEGQDASDAIAEDPLCIEVRSDWHIPGKDVDTMRSGAAEYNILLCTGGPACRIIGKLNRYYEPETAIIEYQDWGTPWERFRSRTEDEDAAVLTYARQFYFGQ